METMILTLNDGFQEFHVQLEKIESKHKSQHDYKGVMFPALRFKNRDNEKTDVYFFDKSNLAKITTLSDDCLKLCSFYFSFVKDEKTKHIAISQKISMLKETYCLEELKNISKLLSIVEDNLLNLNN